MDNDISRCERYPTSRYARVEVGPLGEQPIPVVVRTGSDSFLILPGFFYRPRGRVSHSRGSGSAATMSSASDTLSSRAFHFDLLRHVNSTVGKYLGAMSLQ